MCRLCSLVSWLILRWISVYFMMIYSVFCIIVFTFLIFLSEVIVQLKILFIIKKLLKYYQQFKVQRK